MIHIGKKRSLPECCPVCGNPGFRVPKKTEGRTFSELLSEAFKNYAGTWRAIRGRSPIGLTTWFGYCGKCEFIRAVYGPSPIYKSMRSRNENNSMIPVPLTWE